MPEAPEEVLKWVVRIIPMIQDLTTGDLSLSICDTEKCLFYKAGRKLDFKVPLGGPVLPASGMYKAIHENKRIVARVPKETFGIPYIAIAAPVHDDSGKVIGGISVQETVDKQDALYQMASVLNKQINELSVSAEVISGRAEELAAVGQTVVAKAKTSVTRVKDTNSIVGFIKNIAGQTNLLGLNAAIEAARVGESGRGFGVVAQEIRKLATTSAESIQKIDSVLKAIQQDSQETSHEMEKIDSVTNEVAAAITQIAAAVGSVAEQINLLQKVAESLSSEDDSEFGKYVLDIEALAKKLTTK